MSVTEASATSRIPTVNDWLEEVEGEAADAVRLREAEVDAATYRSEVRSVIRAQQQQIAVLEQQAQQLANEAAAEQRYSSMLVANDRSTRLSKLQQEHSALTASLESEGRKALDLAGQLQTVEAGHLELRNNVTRLDSARMEVSKVRTGPLAAKVRRTLSAADDATAAATSFRQEIDHLRKERLVFLDKMRDLELQLVEQQEVNAKCEQSIRLSSNKREQTLVHARKIEGAAERRSRLRQVQRQDIDTRQRAVEVQARQVRSKLRERMISATNAATAVSGAAMLHKARMAKSAWPPLADKEGLLAGVPQPQTLREVVIVMSQLMGCANDLEAVCESLAAQDKEVAARTSILEEQRRELALAEERNERLRRELLTLESTGGGDSAEHLTLREQLTEMQAQGVAIQAAESRHALILENCAASTVAFLAAITGEPASKLVEHAGQNHQLFMHAEAILREQLGLRELG